MTSDAAKLARWVTPHRSQLIKLFSLHFDGSSKAAAEYLTKTAIDAEYISPRSCVPGENLKQWVLHQNAPFWACRSAFDYLMLKNWQPETDIERALYARFARANSICVDATMQATLADFWVMACNAEKELYNDDEQ